MAKSAANKTGESFTVELYQRLYIPLSTFYAHSTGIGLLRHVSPNDRLVEKPMRVWSHRAAVHAVDACMGRFAAALADRAGKAAEPVVDYGNAHMDRTVTPVFVFATRRGIRTVRWSMLPAAYRSLASLRRYYHSGTAAQDTYAQGTARTERELVNVLAVVDSDIVREHGEQGLKRLAEALAESVGNAAGLP